MAGEHLMDYLTTTEGVPASVPLPPAANATSRGAQPVEWEELDGPVATTQAGATRTSGKETTTLRVELGRAHIGRDDVPKLRTGAVVPLESAAGDSVDIYAGQQLIARGQVLAIDGRFGVRVVERVNFRT